MIKLFLITVTILVEEKLMVFFFLILARDRLFPMEEPLANTMAIFVNFT